MGRSADQVGFAVDPEGGGGAVRGWLLGAGSWCCGPEINHGAEIYRGAVAMAGCLGSFASRRMARRIRAFQFRQLCILPPRITDPWPLRHLLADAGWISSTSTMSVGYLPV